MHDDRLNVGIEGDEEAGVVLIPIFDNTIEIPIFDKTIEARIIEHAGNDVRRRARARSECLAEPGPTPLAQHAPSAV